MYIVKRDVTHEYACMILARTQNEFPVISFIRTENRAHWIFGEEVQNSLVRCNFASEAELISSAVECKIFLSSS